MEIDRMLRSMAWERAKGELNSMGYTFYDKELEKFEKFSKQLDQFIDEIESNELNC